MGQLNAGRIFKAIKGLFSALDQTDEDLLKTVMWRETRSVEVTDGGTAGTAQTETVAWRNDTGGDVWITDLYLVTPVNVTANATNYATFSVFKRTSAGASQATIGAFATDTVTTDDLVAFAPKAIPMTDANRLVPNGSVVTVSVSKTASGVAIAAATSQANVLITYEPAV